MCGGGAALSRVRTRGLERDSAGEGGAAEVHSFPSLAMPLYPEVRLARPRAADLERLIYSFRPDLVHCETEFGIGRAGKAAARRAGMPVVSSYHTDFARYTEAYGARWLKGVVSRYIARFHRTSRRVYTPSTVARQDLLRLGLTDVEVWGRGVDTELFHPGRRGEALRAALGMGSRYTFLYVGRLASEKRADQVLDAFRLASEMLPRGVIHLVVAGTGPREAELRAAAPPGVDLPRPARPAQPPARPLRQLRRLRVRLGDRDAGAGRAGGDGERASGHRGAGGRGARPPARRAQRARLPRGRRAGDGAGDGPHRDRVGAEPAAGAGGDGTVETLSWEREIERLDRSYREVSSRGGGLTAASGNQQVTVVPRPRSLSAETRPPWASTRCFTIASPRPVPPSSREREASAR